MTPQRQLYRDVRQGGHGDCHRTCIAMILDMDRDDVPHFMEHCAPGLPADHPDSIAAEEAERAWLAQRGLAPVSVPFSGDMPLDQLVEQFRRTARGSAVILGCTSSSGGNHSVVLHDGQIHNPNYSEVVGPMLDGMWWVTVLAASTAPLHDGAPPASVATQEEQSDV